jgi:uncharacterized protein YceK
VSVKCLIILSVMVFASGCSSDPRITSGPNGTDIRQSSTVLDQDVEHGLLLARNVAILSVFFAVLGTGWVVNGK